MSLFVGAMGDSSLHGGDAIHESVALIGAGGGGHGSECEGTKGYNP